MKNSEVEKSRAFSIGETLGYISNSVAVKTIIAGTTGSVIAIAFDAGQVRNEKILPFDTLIQIIDGNAEIRIGDRSHLLDVGQSIIVPAHTQNTIVASQRFKMLVTVIKSGYEDSIVPYVQ